ncbi:hypothetical protein TanjilG_28393 [Lupinus angustifolius]|uniref:Uncharacterized protein n=1 Tax=Lupinus angustifolius TaxID=3871 RepID=A0A394DCV0_LUPAN|nr:hypothetical protein TanjilG_28393 [Lupinus angustifolius]
MERLIKAWKSSTLSEVYVAVRGLQLSTMDSAKPCRPTLQAELDSFTLKLCGTCEGSSGHY